MRACIPLACCFACLPALAAPAATIELLPEASVRADQVLLGEVARVHANELALARRLVHLPIGRAPHARQPASVSREALAQWVRRQDGLAGAELAWGGAEAARVIRASLQVPGAQVAAAAVEALRTWLGAAGPGADIQVRAWPRDLEFQSGEVRLAPRPPGHAAVRSRMVVWVDVWSGATLARSVPVTLEIGEAASLPALAGAPLEAPLAAAAEVAPIGRQPAAVLRGEWATLRSTAGVVTLESRVEVLQDGLPGQRVRVRQPGATGVVFARVLGPAQLELAP